MAENQKLRNIAKIVKEIVVQSGQNVYDISGVNTVSAKFFYRTAQNLFIDLPSGDYTVTTNSNNITLTITNSTLLTTMEAIQICYVLDLTSSRYTADVGLVDTNQLKDEYNKLVDDVHVLWNYIKKVGMIADDTSIPLILPQLNTDEVWVKTDDGYKGISLTDAEGEIKKVIEAYTNEMKKVLDAYVENPLKPRLDQYVEDVNKPALDEHVTTVNKPELDRYTTELEKRLQIMIDQAVADKGLMPSDKDWYEVEFGNWLVTDLFNKNYTHYPPQLGTLDKDGVLKKDIVDGGRTQVIRFYTTTGKMLFIVKANGVWSEWQELGEQTDTMQFTQANHGFIFTAVTLDGTTRKWVKANKYTSADGIAIKIDNDRFDVVTRGVVNIPTQARDDKGEPFVYDEYYFLSQEVDGGLSRTKNEIGTFQYLAHISEIDGKQVAYIDIGDSYDLDYEVVDTETADMIGIGTYKTTMRTADTIEDLKRLNLKVGDVVEVLGYYIKGDGADHKRKIESSDDGSGILLNNGLYANIIHNGEVNVSWFGAKGDNQTDDFDFFEKAIKIANVINIPSGKFILSKPLQTNGKTIIGCGGLKTYLVFSNTDGVIINKNKTNIRDFSIFYNEINNVESFGLKCATADSHTYMNTIRNIIIWNSYIGIGSFEKAIFSSIFSNVEIRNFSKTGISFLAQDFGYTGSIFENIYIQNSEQPKKLLKSAIHLNGMGDSIFNQINIENISCENFIFVEACKNISFNGVHFEKAHCITPSISSTSLFRVSQSIISVNGMSYVFSDIDTEKDINIFYSNKDNIINVNGIYINNITKIKSSNIYLFNDENSTKSSAEILSYDNRSSLTLQLKGDDVLNNFNDVISKTKKIKLLNKATFEECIEHYNEIGYCDDGFLTPSTTTGFTISSIGHYNHIIGRGDVGTTIISTPRSSSKNIYIKKKIGDNLWTDWRIIQFTDTTTTLNTPYYINLMEQEGGTTKQDFYTYLGEKIAYDKQLEAEQQAKQEAYQLALTNNPNLTYEEFIASYPMMLPNIEEPTIPQSVQEFMKKYL